MNDIFESCTRSAGDLAGVFEFDGDTSYFYLYKINERNGNKVLKSLRIQTGEPDFIETDVSIRWDTSEQKVGLFIRNVLCGMFDTKE